MTPVKTRALVRGSRHATHRSFSTRAPTTPRSRMRARAALEDRLGQSGHKVKCRAAKFDRSCRIVAQCSLDDSRGGDIGGAMIAAGMAYGFSLDEALPWEARASQRYATAEAEARKQRQGLWKDWLGEK